MFSDHSAPTVWDPHVYVNLQQPSSAIDDISSRVCSTMSIIFNKAHAWATFRDIWRRSWQWWKTGDNTLRFTLQPTVLMGIQKTFLSASNFQARLPLNYILLFTLRKGGGEPFWPRKKSCKFTSFHSITNLVTHTKIALLWTISQKQEVAPGMFSSITR